MKSNKIKGRMRELGMSQSELAKYMGITLQCLNAKLNGRSTLSIDEANQIAQALKIDDPGEVMEIFFTNTVA